MQTVIVIPARFKSTRYPGKPLARVAGREAILWTLEAAAKIAGDMAVYVATDDERIRSVVEAHAGKVLMTSEECRNGTERVAEAAQVLGLGDEDVVVNLQGDSLLTPSWFVESIVKTLKDDKRLDLATPILRCDSASYDHFVKEREVGRVGATTVVVDSSKRAIYFSKEVLPFQSKRVLQPDIPVFHHVGVYAYRVNTLKQYSKWPIGPLERAEQLEQLRFIEMGKLVGAVEVESKGEEFWELNNPEDVAVIEAMIARRKDK